MSLPPPPPRKAPPPPPKKTAPPKSTSAGLGKFAAADDEEDAGDAEAIKKALMAAPTPNFASTSSAAPPKTVPPPPATKAPPPPATKAPPPPAPEPKKAPPPPAPEPKKAPPPPAPEPKKAPPPPAPEPKKVPPPAAPTPKATPAPSTTSSKPTGTFERPALRSSSNSVKPSSPAAQVSSPSRDRAATASASPASPAPTSPTTLTKTAPGGKIEIPKDPPSTPAVGGGGASPMSTEAMQWIQDMKQVNERSTVGDLAQQEKLAIENTARDELFFLYMAEHSRRSVLNDRTTARQSHVTTHRRDMDGLLNMEMESRASVVTEEASVRSSVALPHLCARQMESMVSRQKNSVVTALDEFKRSQNNSNPDTERVANRLDSIETALSASLSQAATDPMENWYYKCRGLAKQEVEARDFLEDLQLSLRRDMVQMCCNVALSPFNRAATDNSPMRMAGGGFVDPYESSPVVGARRQLELVGAGGSPPRGSTTTGHDQGGSPGGSSNKWVHFLTDVFQTEMAFTAQNAGRYAALFADNGFLACVEGATDVAKARQILGPVLAEVTSQDLQDMGVSSLGERKAIVAQLKKLNAPAAGGSSSSAMQRSLSELSESPQLSGSQTQQQQQAALAVNPSFSNPSALAMTNSFVANPTLQQSLSNQSQVFGVQNQSQVFGVQNQSQVFPPQQQPVADTQSITTAGATTANPMRSVPGALVAELDPKDAFEHTFQTSGSVLTSLGIYMTTTRKKLRKFDQTLQAEWESLRRVSFSPLNRNQSFLGGRTFSSTSIGSQEQGSTEDIDAKWEKQWRQACIHDLGAEAEWETCVKQLKDRAGAGLSVELEDLPPTPFAASTGKGADSEEGTFVGSPKRTGFDDSSMRQKLVKHRKAGLTV